MVPLLLAKPDLRAAGKGTRGRRSASGASELPGASLFVAVGVTGSKAKPRPRVQPEKVEVDFSGTTPHRLSMFTLFLGIFLQMARPPVRHVKHPKSLVSAFEHPQPCLRRWA